MAIRELTKNKKYAIELTIGYNGNERMRIYETVYGGKKEALLREAQLKLESKNNKGIANKKITVSALMLEWLEASKNNWAPKTYSSNQCWTRIINKHIGHINLKNLNVKILENFYKQLKEETTLAENSIRHIYTVLSTALNKAVIWEYISDNPNRKVEKPKARKKEIECYSPIEVKNLSALIKNESLKYQALITLAIDSGARRGELTGLTWDDIDFKTGYVTINKATQYSKELGIYEKAPKNESSIRTFKLSDITIKVLRKYNKEQLEKKLRLGSLWKNSKRIFTTEYGADMHPDTPSKIFQKVIAKYNLKRITFHGLRHTSISLQIADGIQSQIISKRAGHSNVTVTHSVYSHFFKEQFNGVADTMNNYLNA